MDAWTTFRLAVWRELNARWVLLLALPLAWAAGALIDETYRAAWDLFTLLLLVPGVTAVVAARSPGTTDAFWLGLGGPERARIAGLLTVQLPALALPTLLIHRRWALVEAVDSFDAAELLVALLALVSVLYSAIFAARSVTSGPAVIAGPLAVLAAAAVTSALWPFNPGTPLMSAAILAALGMGALGLLFGWRWQSRLGVWGASVRGGARARVGATSVGAAILMGSVAAVLPVAPQGSDEGYEVSSHPGAEGALYVPSDYWKAWWRRSGTTLRWTPEGYAPIGGWGAMDGKLGPGGAVAMVRAPSPFSGAWEASLNAPDGRRVTCALEGQSWLEGWRADGGAVLLARGGDYQVMDIEAGCGRLFAADDAAWSGDTLVTIEDKQVFLDGVLAGDFQDADHIFPMSLGEAGVVSATWSRPRAVRSFRIEAGGLTPLFEREEGYKHFGIYSGGFCLGTPEEGWRCLLTDGRSADFPLTEWPLTPTITVREVIDGPWTVGSGEAALSLCGDITRRRLQPADEGRVRYIHDEGVLEFSEAGRTWMPLRRGVFEETPVPDDAPRLCEADGPTGR